MKVIFLGAGRGSRLMPYTEDCPKSLTELHGRRLLDYGIEAMRAAQPTEMVCVVGWCGERVEAAYPELAIRRNPEWASTNMLHSLLCAADCMNEGFFCAYTDILYRPEIVAALAESSGDIVLGVDTRWRERYQRRTQHPEDDAEKVLAAGDRVTRLDRRLSAEDAHGEYIGVARFSPRGAALLREHYARCRAAYEGRPFQQARDFGNAYLIDLLQEMIEQGVPIHKVDTAGGYHEIDTLEDYELALREWPTPSG